MDTTAAEATTMQQGFHRIHSWPVLRPDNPHDGSLKDGPYRPGRYCGPACDLYEDPEPEGGARHTDAKLLEAFDPYEDPEGPGE